MDELVTVIIPVYNKQDFLSACIDSVLRQTYGKVEIVCVDDGSKDQSPAILSALEKEGKIRLITQENRGISAARNRGIEAALGKYLIFLDADDSLPENAVSILVSAMHENDADLCSGRQETVRNGVVCEQADEPGHTFVSGTEMLDLCLRDYATTHHVWAAMFRKDFLGDIRFDEDASVHEDNHFMFELAAREPHYQMIDAVVYRYTVTENSFSRSGFSRKKAEDILRLAGEEYAVVLNQYPQFRDLAENLMIKADMAVLANHPDRDIAEPAIRDVKMRSHYFIPESSFDKQLFRLITHNLYWVYGIAHTVRFKEKR